MNAEELKELENEIEQVKKWSRNPLSWVTAHWPDLVLSTQQKQAFQELGKLITAKLKLANGEKLDKDGERYARKIGISIQSGNGTGKDAFAAWVNWFFLACFPYPKNLCTANTKQQLKNVLWSEMAKWMRKSVKTSDGIPVLQELFEYQAEKIYRKTEAGSQWFTEAVTINTKGSDEEQAESIAGRHEDYQLITVDEASGISDAVFRKLERTLTRKLNIMLIIFNPTRGKGYAIDSQTDPRFIKLRWNAEDSELVPKAQIEGIEETYGRDSNPYRIGVLGLPPLTDENTLIPHEWIEDAKNREIYVDKDDPIIKAVDVGAGGDKNVILTRHGGKVTKITRNNFKDTMQFTSLIATEIDVDEPKMTVIDTIAIGKPVYDRLKESGKKVWPCDVRRSAMQEQRFFSLRDELWWKLREQFEKGTISIPKDKELCDQLSVMTWSPMEGSQKIKVESKKSMKRRGKHSPDEADALMMTYAVNDAMFRPQAKAHDAWDDVETVKTTSWMAA